MVVKKKAPIRISAHDLTQLEVKALHDLSGEVGKGDSVYFEEEILFFIPSSLGINKNSYSKEKFYRSLTNYVRIKTPQFLEEDEISQCRIDRILPTLFNAYENDSQKATWVSLVSISDAIFDMRKFGAYMNDQLKLISRIEGVSGKVIHLQHLSALIESFRKMIDGGPSVVSQKEEAAFLSAYSYIDEFISHRFEETLVKLSRLGVEVQPFFEIESKRRRDKGYIDVVSHSEKSEKAEELKELYSFRMGQLKKYVSEVLYLEVKRFRRDKVFGHFAAGLGAGMAALMVALFNPAQRTTIFKDMAFQVGASLPLMFGTAVLFYVFQDRMKDALKEKFLTWLTPWIPDYRFQISSGKTKIADCEEEMCFTSLDHIDDEMKRLRTHDSFDLSRAGEPKEEILHYERRLKVESNRINCKLTHSKSIKDILRVDLHPFLYRLGNSVKTESFFDERLNVVQVSIPKVYHVNVVVRHQTKTQKGKTITSSMASARVVLDKNGVKRVEELACV